MKDPSHTLDRLLLLTVLMLLVILASSVALNVRLREINARLAALNIRLPDVAYMLEKH